jgi:hypothetical protein
LRSTGAQNKGSNDESSEKDTGSLHFILLLLSLIGSPIHGPRAKPDQKYDLYLAPPSTPSSIAAAYTPGTVFHRKVLPNKRPASVYCEIVVTDAPLVGIFVTNVIPHPVQLIIARNNIVVNFFPAKVELQ